MVLLHEQGRVTELPNGPERIQAIARDYAAKPESTIIVSPDDESRQQLNEAVRVELKEKGILSGQAETFRTLTKRNDMTCAERTWAARFEVGNVLHYTTGSKAEGTTKDSYAIVRSVDTTANRLTVELEGGRTVSYDPKRLRGGQRLSGECQGVCCWDRIQFTKNEKKLDVRSRDLAAVVSAEPGKMTVHTDGKAERIGVSNGLWEGWDRFTVPRFAWTGHFHGSAESNELRNCFQTRSLLSTSERSGTLLKSGTSSGSLTPTARLRKSSQEVPYNE